LGRGSATGSPLLCGGLTRGSFWGAVLLVSEAGRDKGMGGERRQNLCCAKVGNKIEVVRRQNFRVFGDVGKGQRHVRHELRGRK
jgi:hypothetical protein